MLRFLSPFVKGIYGILSCIIVTPIAVSYAAPIPDSLTYTTQDSSIACIHYKIDETTVKNIPYIVECYFSDIDKKILQQAQSLTHRGYEYTTAKNPESYTITLRPDSIVIAEHDSPRLDPTYMKHTLPGKVIALDHRVYCRTWTKSRIECFDHDTATGFVLSHRILRLEIHGELFYPHH